MPSRGNDGIRAPFWASLGWHPPPGRPRGKAIQAETLIWFFADLGPGLITRAAEDDLSGIPTTSVAGDAFG